MTKTKKRNPTLVRRHQSEMKSTKHFHPAATTTNTGARSFLQSFWGLQPAGLCSEAVRLQRCGEQSHKWRKQIRCGCRNKSIDGTESKISLLSAIPLSNNLSVTLFDSECSAITDTAVFFEAISFGWYERWRQETNATNENRLCLYCSFWFGAQYCTMGQWYHYALISPTLGVVAVEIHAYAPSHSQIQMVVTLSRKWGDCLSSRALF